MRSQSTSNVDETGAEENTERVKKLRALLALLVLELLPFFVIAVVIAVFAVAIRLAESMNNAAMIIKVLILPLLIGLYLAIKAAVTARPEPAQGPELTREQAPALWAQVDELTWMSDGSSYRYATSDWTHDFGGLETLKQTGCQACPVGVGAVI